MSYEMHARSLGIYKNNCRVVSLLGVRSSVMLLSSSGKFDMKADRDNTSRFLRNCRAFCPLQIYAGWLAVVCIRLQISI